jgi:hypothetical protein
MKSKKKKKIYAKLRLQNLKSQINPLTHSDTVSTAFTQIIIYLVKKRVKSMVLKTGLVREPKKRVAIGYLVGSRLD